MKLDKEAEMKCVVKELENIFSIDGRGRPKKCQSFLRLLSNYGIDNIKPLIEEMATRQYF